MGLAPIVRRVAVSGSDSGAGVNSRLDAIEARDTQLTLLAGSIANPEAPKDSEVALAAATTLSAVPGNRVGYVSPDGVEFAWSVRDAGAGAVTVARLLTTADLSRIDALESGIAGAELVGPLQQSVDGLLDDSRRYARVPWAAGNDHLRIEATIAGCTFDFDAVTESNIDLHPQAAPDGVWRLMHEAQCLPFVQEIVRYLREGQEVYLSDQSEWRLVRDPANGTDRATFPTTSAAVGLWVRTK